jgi:F-type H+-transporting ATPase subunit gamma
MPGFGADKTASGRHKVLVVLLSPDKGLAGSLNTNVIAKALKVVKDEGAEKVDFISMGRKGTDALRRTGQNIVAVLPGKDRDVRAHDARPITEIAIADFLAYKYDKVMVVYTDFISTLVQKPNMLQVLPFTAEPARDSGTDDFLFEPSPGEVMEQAIRRYIEFAVYQCMLEAAASEHSARMVAMKNANQSANDLIDELTLSANQARQANITRELSEISAAKIAMEG